MEPDKRKNSQLVDNIKRDNYKASAFVARYSVRTFDEAVNIFGKYILENFQHSTFVV